MGQLGLEVVSNTTLAIFWVGGWAAHPCVAPIKNEQESTISTPNQYLSSEVNIIVRETDWQPMWNLLIRCISTFIFKFSCIKAIGKMIDQRSTAFIAHYLSTDAI